MFDEVPVDDVREYGGRKPRPLVPVINVIGVFPNIEREQRNHPVMRHWRVRVVERSDPKRAPIEHQPRPAAGEMVDRLFLQLLKHCVGIAERVVDEVRELASRALTLRWSEALPEEAVVPQLRAVVEQLAVSGPVRLADHLREGCAAQRLILLEQFVRFVDVGLVVLAVVKLESLGRHVRRECILIVGQIG